MATELEDIEQLDIPEIENIEQPPRKKSFKANGKIFDIPEDKVGDFKKRYSDAQEIQSFTNNGKTYDIPIERVEEFKQKYPDAKTLGGTQQPQSQQPTPKVDDYTLETYTGGKSNPVEAAQNVNVLNSAKKAVTSSVSLGGNGVVNTEITDENKVNEAKKIKEQLKSEGYDEDFFEAVKDLPKISDGSEFSYSNLANLYKNNKPQFYQSVASVKWQTPIHHAIDVAIRDVENDNKLTPLQKQEKINGMIDDRNLLYNGQLGGEDVGYSDQLRAFDADYEIINKYISNEAERKRALKNLSIDHENSFGSAAAVRFNEVHPIDGLNPIQSLGYQYYIRVHPEQKTALDKYISLKDKDFKSGDGISDGISDEIFGNTGLYSAKIARDSKLRELEQQGYDLIYNNANGKYSTYLQKNNEQGGLSYEDISKANYYDDIMTNAKYNKKALDIKYPEIAALDANKLAQEELGQQHRKLDWVFNEFAGAMGNFSKGTYNLLAYPFRSKTEQDYWLVLY